MAEGASAFPIMDPVSSSSSRRLWKYDVFVSFRGEDTRQGFTSHLLAALKRKGINAFIDDAEKGMELAYMLKAIDKSRILIVLLSEGYADSTWCLRELKKIMEVLGSEEQTVLSVFYHVDPTDARDPTKLYRKSFTRHRKRYRDDSGKATMKSWKDALQKVPDGLKMNDESESQFIERIVDRVIKILGGRLSNFPVGLVGIERRAQELKHLLFSESNDVRVVGIHGMIGVGKTALARFVYEGIFREFEAACFLSDVSEVSKRHNGLSHLQEKIIRRVLDLEDLKIRGDQEGTILLRTRLRRLKILLVLDDVDHSQQLEKLAGNVDWFGNGSTVIITTRDESILKRYRLQRNQIHKVGLLETSEGLKLFCGKAFGSDKIKKGYEDLTYKSLEYAKGLPFAIESLASSLVEENALKWDGILERLKNIPDLWITRVLRKGFDGLSYLEKKIFLDIACLFVGEDINDVKEILKYCYRFSYEIVIKSLIDKSLMTISDQKIYMHHLVQQMGREVVHQESPKAPEKRSRLWIYDHVHLVNEKSIANVEAIVLNQEDSGRPVRAKVFSNMTHLKLLIIRNATFTGSLDCLSNSLRYVSWYNYPFLSLPPTFEPQRLMKLLLPQSKITQLWEGTKNLRNLTVMSLCDSKDLSDTPDFQGLPNVERLDFEGCSTLLNIHSSIERLAKLEYLNLRNCSSLTSISNNLFRQKSIKILNVAGCTRLAECSDIIAVERVH